MNSEEQNNNLEKGCGLGCLSIFVLILSITYPPIFIVVALCSLGYFMVNCKKYIELKVKLSKTQSNIESLKSELKNIKLTKEELSFLDLKSESENLIECIDKSKKEIDTLNKEKDNLNVEIKKAKNNLEQEKNALEEFDMIKNCGFYETKYGFENSTGYKNKLNEIRKKQKELVKSKQATYHSLDLNLYDDRKKNKEFILDTIKLTLRAFNNECDNIITKATFNNIDQCKQKIEKVFDDLNELTDTQDVSIKHSYLDLKIEELYLKYEYECKIQDEKEEQRLIKERMREEAKALKEIENALKKIEKEEKHFNNAISEIKEKISSSSEDETHKLLAKLKYLEEKLAEVEKSKIDITEREKNTRAGYVYIISNIGSFGENIYKIGMTRRLDPMDRVKELGNASVPFSFDVHAMIFSEDAPALENALHKKFENYSVNKVNLRKEFFKVSLDEIEKEVNLNHNAVVEFTKLAEAADYRQSLALSDY